MNNQISGILRLVILFSIFYSGSVIAQDNSALDKTSEREHISMDFDWRFQFGFANDAGKDFSSGTSYFSYFAKTGYGDGPAAQFFDDRSWRKINVPHDWAVELPFSGTASHSHGYKTVGWKFPETSIGWYRKTFSIPASDLGRKISIQFDGIQRNAIVWVNGFYLGQEHSGYTGTEYDISDYITYGGNNVVTVRADASMEEGWFYEGAGIYRHTWLNKTGRLHVATNGTTITSRLVNDCAELTVNVVVYNQDSESSDFTLEEILQDANGNQIVEESTSDLHLPAVSVNTYISKLKVIAPRLWSLEDPYLYKLFTKVFVNGKMVDNYKTNVGIRTVTFDADKGFFLNGKNLKIKGTNDHQDHAGVGAAIPDSLQDYRIKLLKEMGSNAIRTSHNPATPEMLDACDRLGMLVLEENRLMGIDQEHIDLLKRMIVRDRNHPCIIAWSLGNEEWAIESNILGERITSTMQAYAHSFDSTRLCTVAVSGGCGKGSSRSCDIMGFNYLVQCDIDDYHKKFPEKPSMGTEESTTAGTRGIYEDDRMNGRMAATDRNGMGPAIETGWKFYAGRPFLSGLFYWTGFDYKGEPNPLAWPAISSQYGILDACGFPKDCYYYLKSWWTHEKVLHIAPHWNWNGKEGKIISIWVYSNCQEVELFLNNNTMGRKAMPLNGHLQWNVNYTPGILIARGFSNGRNIITDKVETTGEASAINLSANKNFIKADNSDISIITISVRDKKGNIVPTANNKITLKLNGPGKIIGIGNGDPGSHEPDKYIDTISQLTIDNLNMKKLEAKNVDSCIRYIAKSPWTIPFQQQSIYQQKDKDSLKLNFVRGFFNLASWSNKTVITLYPGDICSQQAIYLNEHLINKDIPSNTPIIIDHSYLIPGNNILIYAGKTLTMNNIWDKINTYPGSIQIVNPAGDWKRKVFGGLAQVIIQSDKSAGKITLSAYGEGLVPAETVIISD